MKIPIIPIIMHIIRKRTILFKYSPVKIASIIPTEAIQNGFIFILSIAPNFLFF